MEFNNSIIICWGFGRGNSWINYSITYTRFCRPVIGPGQDMGGHVTLKDINNSSFIPATRLEGGQVFNDFLMWIIIGI